MAHNNRAAVLGTGQTKYVAKRHDVTMAGMCREAMDAALADAGVSIDEIDAIVIGKAPDLFEGSMMPELAMADALGAVGKRLIRVHTAGSVGGSTANVAASLVFAGVHKRVLAIAWEKQSESNAMWALSLPVPFTKPVGAGAGGFFAPHVRSYIRQSGAPKHIGAMVATKDRRNGARNPLAHLHQPDITVESVMASQMLWDPIRYDETCPSSDGACAVVIGDEQVADAAVAEVLREHDLVVVTDEVYEHLVYDGRAHVPIAILSTALLSVSAALAVFQMLRNLAGTDNYPFTFVSDELNGETVDSHGVVRPLLPRSFATMAGLPGLLK